MRFDNRCCWVVYFKDELIVAVPVYFHPWDIVVYQIQPWKTNGDVLT